MSQRCLREKEGDSMENWPPSLFPQSFPPQSFPPVIFSPPLRCESSVAGDGPPHAHDGAPPAPPPPRATPCTALEGGAWGGEGEGGRCYGLGGEGRVGWCGAGLWNLRNVGGKLTALAHGFKSPPEGVSPLWGVASGVGVGSAGAAGAAVPRRWEGFEPCWAGHTTMGGGEQQRARARGEGLRGEGVVVVIEGRRRSIVHRPARVDGGLWCFGMVVFRVDVDGLLTWLRCFCDSGLPLAR